MNNIIKVDIGKWVFLAVGFMETTIQALQVISLLCGIITSIIVAYYTIKNHGKKGNPGKIK